VPNSNDAAKRHRQSLKARVHNRSIKSTVRTSIKSFEVAVKNNNKSEAEACYARFIKLIDTAAGKGLYHKNTAARKKSRLHKVLVGLA
jgi:small subunit ribosomal protein S20